MAEDLDFSHRVQQVPAAEPLPETLQRSEKIEVNGIPDYQKAFNDYAARTNWMSAVGSAVASAASNQIATQLGAKAGETPQGELGPAITDYDKVFENSYKTQAHATLSIQADKLITDANIQMASLPRITPDILAKTQQQISLGLKNILNNAPTEIKPQLEYSFTAAQLNQSANLSERMFREQKQDRKANSAFANNLNAENAHASAMAGNMKAAMESVKSTEALNKADLAAGIITPIEAKVNINTARQSAYIGLYSHLYEQAKLEGKEGEFLSNLSKKKPNDLSDADYPVVMSHLLSYATEQDSLRKRDQALAMAKFNVSLAEDPMGITGSQVADLQTKLDPTQFQQASLAYVKAVKAQQKQRLAINNGIARYSDPTAFVTLDQKAKDGAWQLLTQSLLTKPENIAKGLTEDDAKIQAAAIAAGPIPQYINELNLKGSKADPQNLDTVAHALNYLESHNLNQNVMGITDETHAMIATYGQLRQTMNPVEAAQQAHEVIFNKSKEQKEANNAALAEYINKQKSYNESKFGMFKRLIGLSDNTLIRNLPGYDQKAVQTFSNFFKITNGDEQTALQLTKDYMDNQYGMTNINGDNEYTFHPVEKIPGVPEDANGAIQSDIVEQVSKNLQESKKLYDNHQSDFWYEIKQEITADEAQTSKIRADEINEDYAQNPLGGLVFDLGNKRDELHKHLAILNKYNNQSITVVKHNRNGKEEVFEGAIQANPWGQSTGINVQPLAGGYDFMLKTEHGMKNLTMQNPLSSHVTYNPRIDVIQRLYLLTHGISVLQFFNIKNSVSEKHSYQPTPLG